MPAEHAEPEHPDPLSVLGQVDPPAPGVLDNAREALWAVVAAEMLSDNSPREQAANDVREQAANDVREQAANDVREQAANEVRKQTMRRRKEADS